MLSGVGDWSLDSDVDDVDDDDDETVSMVTSPDSEVDLPALKALNARNRSLEISEQYLRQQVSIPLAYLLTYSFPCLLYYFFSWFAARVTNA